MISSFSLYIDLPPTESGIFPVRCLLFPTSVASSLVTLRPVNPSFWRIRQFLGIPLFTGLYRHDEFPASNQDTAGPDGDATFTDLIASKPKEFITQTGTTLCAVDYAPHRKSVFHRTVSVDYGIVTKGAITLILDDGERVKLSAGDVIVQCGTIHEWVNEGDEWTRVFYTLIPSEKVKIGDKELDTEFRFS